MVDESIDLAPETFRRLALTCGLGPLSYYLRSYLALKNTFDLQRGPAVVFRRANQILPLSLLGLWLVLFRDELARFQKQLPVWNVIDYLERVGGERGPCGGIICS